MVIKYIIKHFINIFLDKPVVTAGLPTNEQVKLGKQPKNLIVNAIIISCRKNDKDLI